MPARRQSRLASASCSARVIYEHGMNVSSEFLQLLLSYLIKKIAYTTHIPTAVIVPALINLCRITRRERAELPVALCAADQTQRLNCTCFLMPP